MGVTWTMILMRARPQSGPGCGGLCSRPAGSRDRPSRSTAQSPQHCGADEGKDSDRLKRAPGNSLADQKRAREHAGSDQRQDREVKRAGDGMQRAVLEQGVAGMRLGGGGEPEQGGRGKTAKRRQMIHTSDVFGHSVWRGRATRIR